MVEDAESDDSVSGKQLREQGKENAVNGGIDRVAKCATKCAVLNSCLVCTCNEEQNRQMSHWSPSVVCLVISVDKQCSSVL